MTFDPTKPVQTRDGRAVEIKFTDGRGEYPIVGYVGNTHLMQEWTSEGRYISGSKHEDTYDLVNIPQKHTVWVNIYKNVRMTVMHSTREDADVKTDDRRIACVSFTYEDGEGL